jgi:F-type H+-transporting ATPase subunit epsilon
MSELTVDVISPEKPLYSGKADSVTARAFDGDVGILSGHAPMLTKLGTGQVVITKGSTVTRFAIQSGFLEVADNKVVVLSEKAVAVEDAHWVKAEVITATEKELSETTDPARREELEERLAWMRACEKLRIDVQ